MIQRFTVDARSPIWPLKKSILLGVPNKARRTLEEDPTHKPLPNDDAASAALSLVTGGVSFVACFWFVRSIFAAVKVD